MTTTLEVHTTYELVCKGVLYTNITNIPSPTDTINVVNNTRKERLKISNRLYNINTNSYKNLITNKDVQIVNLYEEFEDHILSKDKKIIRNFIKKGIVFKLNIRIAEVNIKQNEFIITFLKNVKKYDNKDLMYIKKGYEKDKLSLCLKVDNEETLEYAKKILDREYQILNDNEEQKYIEDLEDELCIRTRKINSSITSLKTIKGRVFKGKRNFCIVEKRKNCLYMRLLPVKDEQGILGKVGRGSYDPLSKKFIINKVEDIDVIIPYLKVAYEMTKYPASDINNGIINID